MANNYKNLFLQQSYKNAVIEYDAMLTGSATVSWDYVVLTASCEAQAESYRRQIEYRIARKMLPTGTEFLVISDPDGKRVGSGGATLNLLYEIAVSEGAKCGKCGKNPYKGLRILCIHSGGDSKRVPQYSACGKLFSPVPRPISGAASSTLFDELMMLTCGIPKRMSDGMLICSGDVLFLFDLLGVDHFSGGATALSVKTEATVGCNHGVYLGDGGGLVKRFLHKLPVDELTSIGAVDELGNVDIDTGAVLLGSDLLSELYGLVDTPEKLSSVVNERVRLSFYADISYPLSAEATLESYLKEKPEGELTPELIAVRRQLWERISRFNMRLNALSPASFLHFGTTRELLSLMTEEIEDYAYLGWERRINCSGDFGESVSETVTLNGADIEKNAVIRPGSYIEDSVIESGATVGEGCVISSSTVPFGVKIPDGTVVSTVSVLGGYAARIYGVCDDPKQPYHLGRKLDTPLWNAEIFPVCSTPGDAVRASVERFFGKEYSGCSEAIEVDREVSLSEFDASGELVGAEARGKFSLLSSFRFFYGTVKEQGDANRVVNLYGELDGFAREQLKKGLCGLAESLFTLGGFSGCRLAMRIYGYLYHATGEAEYRDRCFEVISRRMLDGDSGGLCGKVPQKSESTVSFPVRVNFGGGWTDTPPYCLENGGAVLNAAVILGDSAPVTATARVISQRKIVLVCEDGGLKREFDEDALCRFGIQEAIAEDGRFDIHRAALYICFMKDKSIGAGEFFDTLGGGLELCTSVRDIPKGSGLGTSSILAAALVSAVYGLFGESLSDRELWNKVLILEQYMSTGGGWQDQIGGVVPGIKLITTESGAEQVPVIQRVNISEAAKTELESRFAVIYTGQRRLAKNLLRQVMGRYIVSESTAVSTLAELKKLPFMMKERLEAGDIDGFGGLLTENWRLTLKLDEGCTNRCIDEIFAACDDLICGKMICGAGGGGYLQVVLKKGVSILALQTRLREKFGECDIKAQGCVFI